MYRIYNDFFTNAKFHLALIASALPPFLLFVAHIVSDQNFICVSWYKVARDIVKLAVFGTVFCSYTQNPKSLPVY